MNSNPNSSGAPHGHAVKMIRNSHAHRDPLPGSPLVGHSSGLNLVQSAQGHPVILYSGRFGTFFLVGDYYQMDGAPSYLNIYCPLCAADPQSQRGSLRISQDNKAMDYDPYAVPTFKGYRTEDILAGLEVPDLGGRISVEPFGCTWEAEPTLRRSYGFAVCPWRVSIDNNLARDV